MKQLLNLPLLVILVATLTFLVFSGCASTPMEKKQAKTLDCVKDLIQNDAETLEAFEVCRQVYRIKRVKEHSVSVTGESK